MEQTLQKQEQLALHLCTDYQCKYKKKKSKKKKKPLLLFYIVHQCFQFFVNW